MYSQQHTIPMTGDRRGEDLSTENPLSCTQPVTTKSRQPGVGFLKKLSHRSCSMKAVATAACNAIEEESANSFKEEHIRSWGSTTNLHSDENISTSIMRSPSMPSLHPSKMNVNMKMSPTLEATPQQHAGMKRKGLTPLHNDFQSVTKTKQELHPSSKFNFYDQQANYRDSCTPQHGKKTNLIATPRAPLQSITPINKQAMSYIKDTLQQPVPAEKENTQPSVASPPRPAEAATAAMRQKLIRGLLEDSPPVIRTSAEKTSPPQQPYRRSLFETTPIKQEINPIPSFKLESKTNSSVKLDQHLINQPRITPMKQPVVSAHQETVKQQTVYTENSHIQPPRPTEALLTPRPQPFKEQIVTPKPPRQPEYVFKQPARPTDFVDTPSAFEPARDNHLFKPPPPRVEQPSQDMIMVNNVCYAVGQKLGRGGSSEVYQVTRQSDGAVLAIKCVNLRSVDDIIRQGYLNEINLLKRMQGSTRVVQLIDYELCEKQQVLYVVMEKGARDLASFLKDRARRRDLRLGTVEAFWKDMVEAVAAIHERSIIHSDLKPANFLLVGEVGFHQLKLIDFGIASSLQSDMTSVVQETPAGTLNYMSPETVRGMQGQQCPVKINYKSDIWSLGCILYNLLYGRSPFQLVTHPGLKAEAICNPQHAIEFPVCSPILPGDGTISPTLLRTVKACLSRDPNARPSAPELLATKFCGCEDNQLDFLAQGLATMIRGHPQGEELATRVFAALQGQARP